MLVNNAKKMGDERGKQKNLMNNNIVKIKEEESLPKRTYNNMAKMEMNNEVKPKVILLEPASY